MKNVYEVVWLKDDEIIYESDLIVADNPENAKAKAIIAAMDYDLEWEEGIRVLCRPFRG